MEKVLILGIDTSCDDTSASVVLNGKKILSNIVSSQVAVHGQFGGIVPELASRRHIEMIWPVVNTALEQGGVKLSEITAISVCKGPGLIGSLLVGLCFAKSLSYVSGVPLIGVNHLEGHIYSNFLSEPVPEYPFLTLIVSGGHTSLILVREFGDYEVLGSTRDDAAGEAFDKVAKLLGLPYPGGPVIEKLAKGAAPDMIPLPRPMLNEGLDFSFSGLKTAVKNELRARCPNPPVDIETQKNLAASFQEAVIEVLLTKARRALRKTSVKGIALSGGVAANGRLREAFMSLRDEGFSVYLPEKPLCTDNAAMIATSGYLHYLKGNISDLALNAEAVLPL